MSITRVLYVLLLAGMAMASTNSNPPESTCDPLNKIPWDILDEMKEVARYYGWYAANDKLEEDEDATSDKEKIEEHFKTFKDFGLPKPEVCDMFKEMAYFCAMSTTEQKMGNETVAAEMKKNSTDKRDEMVESGEISEGLARQLWELCWYSGWHAANSKAVVGVGLFHKDDTRRAKEKVESLYNEIADDCRLVAFEFFGDDATLVNRTSVYFGRQVLANPSSDVQEMNASFSLYNTQTKSGSTNIKWKFTVAEDIAGLNFVASGFKVALSYSKETTEGGSLTDGETKTYTFAIEVDPNSRSVVTGIVKKCTAEVPYFMIFDIGGKRYCKDGIWKGIVADNVKSIVVETDSLD